MNFGHKYICRRWGFGGVFDEKRGENGELRGFMNMSTCEFNEVSNEKRSEKCVKISQKLVLDHFHNQGQDLGHPGQNEKAKNNVNLQCLIYFCHIEIFLCTFL